MYSDGPILIHKIYEINTDQIKLSMHVVDIMIKYDLLTFRWLKCVTKHCVDIKQMLTNACLIGY